MPDPQLTGAPPAPAAPVGTPASWQDVISAEAKKNGVDPRLALAVAETESGFNPAAKSPKGALGIMQLMPATAAKWKVDPADPVGNIRGGILELKALNDEHKGDVTMVLRRYNGSPQADPALTQPYVDKVLSRLKPSTAAGQPPPATVGMGTAPLATTSPQPTVGEAPPTEGWGDWAKRHGREMLESFDPRNATGRRNLGGGAGAIIGGIIGGATEGTAGAVAGSVVPGAGTVAGAAAGGAHGAATGATIGAAAGGGLVSGAESLYHHFAGTPEEGAAVGTPPPTLPGVARSAAGGAVEQGLYELGGRVVMWPVKALGRQVIASRVGKFAAEKISSSKASTLGALQTALDSSRTLFRAATAGAKTANASAKTTTRQAVSTAAGTVKQAVAGATELGAKHVEGAEGRATAGLTAAGQQATAGEAAARAPYEALVGAPPPDAAAAGRAANAVIQTGGAQEARNAAGRAVEAAAESGPDVDISQLKAEARRILETEIKPPQTAFPRTSPGEVGEAEAAQVAGALNMKVEDWKSLLSQAEKNPTSAAAKRVEQLKAHAAEFTNASPEGQLAAAQAEAAKETLKHPAMQTLNRVLNAEDTVSFADAHKFKRELDEAVGSAWDHSVKSRVTNITKKLRGELRAALTGHQPYNEATAAYQQIAPLYDAKGVGAKLRKLAVQSPESIVPLLNTKDHTKAAMFVDLLTHQAEAGGGGAEGRQALEAVQSAWVRQRLINGGLEKLGDRLEKIPPEFKLAFFNDPKSQAVLDNLKLIHTAFKTAVLTGEQGVTAAKATGKASVGAAGDLAAQRTGAVREAGQQAVEAVRQQGAGIRDQVAATGRSTVEAAREAVPKAGAALREAKSGFRAAEDELADSSLGGLSKRGNIERRGFDVLRVMIQGKSTFGLISLARILHGPTAQDLIHFAAASPGGTRLFVKAITSNTPAKAIADLARSLLPVDSYTDVISGKPPKVPKAEPPPTDPIVEGNAASIGAPPPR